MKETQKLTPIQEVPTFQVKEKLEKLMRNKDESSINEISDKNLLSEMILYACKAISKKNISQINKNIQDVLSSLTKRYTHLVKEEKLDNTKLFKNMSECIFNLKKAEIEDVVIENMAKYILQMTDQNILNDSLKLIAQCAINNKIIYLLIAKGADVNCKENTVTPLSNACQFNNYLAAKVLIEHKADPNLEAYNTPLIFACFYNHKKIGKFLLEHKADPNAGTKSNPLIVTVENNNLEIAKLLLEHKADPNLEISGSSALSLAQNHVKNKQLCPFNNTGNYIAMLNLLNGDTQVTSPFDIDKELDLLGTNTRFFKDEIDY